ncbi:MAG TPA: hypothetical protein DIU09_06065, partial [Hyphomonadaceae bacterium]|nr:hypothetical protein [Hyphomonadaceae bacterium]
NIGAKQTITPPELMPWADALPDVAGLQARQQLLAFLELKPATALACTSLFPGPSKTGAA